MLVQSHLEPDRALLFSSPWVVAVEPRRALERMTRAVGLISPSQVPSVFSQPPPDTTKNVFSLSTVPK